MRLLCVFLTFGCFACGDHAKLQNELWGVDSRSSSSIIDLGEDGTKISELSQAELYQICVQINLIQQDDIANSSFLESMCLYFATQMTGDPWVETTCQTVYDACISEGMPSYLLNLTACTDNMKMEALINCDATVGAYEACLMKSHDSVLEQMEWMAKASCNYASNLALGEPDPAMFGTITECVDLEVLTEGFEEPSCSRLELPWGGAH